MSRLTGLRVLVVEDEAIVAIMLEDMLAAMGCVVVAVAASLARGLALAADDTLAIDAAVLDVNLSGEHAYPIAERLAARGVPFVLSSGLGRRSLNQLFPGAPTLTKPFDVQQLEAALAALVAGGDG